MTLILLLIFALTAGTAAQGNDAEGLKLTGYLESKPSLHFGDSLFYTDAHTFRLQAKRTFGDRAALEGHFVFATGLIPLSPFDNIRPGSAMDTLLSRAVRPLLSTAPVQNLMILLSQMDSASSFSNLEDLYYSSLFPRDKMILDRAMVKLFFPRADLTFGKQRLAWGTGYAWNPTDVWNQKSPLDPKAERPGVIAALAEFPLGQATKLSAVAAPGRDAYRSSGGLRFKSNAGKFDYSLSAAKLMNHDRSLFGLPAKFMFGADLAGETYKQAGIWAEGAFFNRVPRGMKYTDFDSTYFLIDAGSDYTFENGLYVMIEGFYNSLGENDRRDDATASVINLFAGEMPGLGRAYATVGLRKTFFDYYTASLNTLVNAGDGSLAFLPALDYALMDDVELSLSGNVFVGDKKESEYGSFYSAMAFKVKGYF